MYLRWKGGDCTDREGTGNGEYDDFLAFPVISRNFYS